WGFSTVMKREQALEDDVKALRETVLALQAKLEQLETTPVSPAVIAQEVNTIEANTVENSKKVEV
ncbi:MAG: DUF3302 domain-containing protein, partial [Shewanella sp.]